jgi:intracellular sulfur oxidation DsrE/DsrF family protein
MTDLSAGRRQALFSLAAATTGAALLSMRSATAAETAPSPMVDAWTLQALMTRLSQAPRRRDFKTVPMVLDHPDLWDSEALDAVIAYHGTHKQVWDNTEIGSPWMNMMRNSLNAQVFSFRHPDFLVVSATHGSAHLALYDQAAWDKYQLGKLAGPKFVTNTLVVTKDAPGDDAAHEDPKSLFGAPGNTIPTLQERGVVFMACHNAIWEQTGALMEKGVNPDRLTHEGMAAELTNHLVEGVVLTPGIVATIPELQHAGFGYVK